MLECYYKEYNFNVYCGVYMFGMKVIDVYEGVCEKVCKFINVKLMEEIIFICGMIIVLNIVVVSYGFENVKEGDEIVIFYMEYYSNIILW